MLTSKYRLPLTYTQFIITNGLIQGNQQKRHSSLTIQTLNPLVKEVEYAVRG